MEKTVEACTMAGSSFKPARRINHSLTASVERRALRWMAERAPRWLSSDQLTLLGLAAQVGAGISYGVCRYNRSALWLVMLCIGMNWFGDSMDGTLARFRGQQRPRFGFYADHVVDLLGAIALMCGLGLSGLVHWQIALAMLIAFLLLSSESYLATYTVGSFEMSQGVFGPTEIRLLLIIGNLALLRSPFCTVLGQRLLLFDVGGAIASAGMFLIAIMLILQHSAQLYREEPLP